MVTYVFLQYLTHTIRRHQVYIVYKLCWNSVKCNVLPLPWITTTKRNYSFLVVDECGWRGAMVSCWWFKCVKGQRKEIKGGIKGIKREKDKKKKSKECYCIFGRCWWDPCGFFLFFLSSFAWHSDTRWLSVERPRPYQLARFDLPFFDVVQGRG